MITFTLALSYIIITSLAYWAYNIIYNIYFNPLKKVPGPLINMIFPMTNFIYMFTGTNHLHSARLHQKYGNVVRISWDVISIASDETVKEVYSTYSFEKDSFYNGFQITGETLFSTRNTKFHRERKKILASSFSDKSILEVEYLVKENVNNLVTKIGEMSSDKKDFNLGLYFHCFSFDVIGDLVFGKSFDTLKNGHHPVIDWIKNYFIISLVVALFPFLRYYKFNSITQLYKFSYEAVERGKINSNRTTILSTLLNASDPDTGKKLSEKEIVEESILQLVAGIDTTSNSLTWVFYLLAKHPQVYIKLKNELKEQFSNLNQINYIRCKDECDYLRAVIYESMRMFPVVPGGLPRVFPKGGKMIEGYFIPEKTIAIIDINHLQNNPDYWEEPNAFKPERWIDQNGKFQSHKNFMPFLIGPRACLGRSLAWMELYLATASLAYSFNFKLKDDKELESKIYMVNTPERAIDIYAFKNQ
ncbi:cytochrome P450 [Neoconidiobolus thromboides FSU 785]|nr:cytochrome P450 [Neoconidiobolus thromboides FSU 785]